MDTPEQRSAVGPILWGCGAVLFIWVIGGAVAAYVLWHYHLLERTPVRHAAHSVVDRVEAPLPPKLEPLPDIDALAGRMKVDQDVYRKVRDDALAGYLQLHPTPAASDEEARATLRLLAYLEVWTDFYGEGLWQQYDSHVVHLAESDDRSIWHTLKETVRIESRHSSDERNALSHNQEAFDFGTTPYPALFKLMTYRVEIRNLVKARADTGVGPTLTQSLADLPRLVGQATQCYAELVRARYSHEFLYKQGGFLLDATGQDEQALKLVSAGLDGVFAKEDKDNPQVVVLDGLFQVKDAWCARGNGYANTVSSDGWRLFGERLSTANTLLTNLYAAHPEEPGIAHTMMTVVLGQGLPRDQMELWFNRAIKTDADVFSDYMAKRWYLLPRWYGSDEIVREFGLECADSTDWASKVPLVLIEALDDEAGHNPHVYEGADNWAPVEKVFRGYLQRFPDSTIYRSRFLKCAVEGQHWEVAAEQIQVLGDHWDRAVFRGDAYSLATRMVREHQSPGH